MRYFHDFPVDETLGELLAIPMTTHRPGQVHLDGFDLLPRDLAVEISAYHLDLREFRHPYPPVQRPSPTVARHI
jgi:hypothetical protein